MLNREAVHAQAVAALDVVIHLTRALHGVRRVAEVDVVTRADGDAISIRPAFVVDDTGVSTPGPGRAVLADWLSRRGQLP